MITYDQHKYLSDYIIMQKKIANLIKKLINI